MLGWFILGVLAIVGYIFAKSGSASSGGSRRAGDLDDGSESSWSPMEGADMVGSDTPIGTHPLYSHDPTRYIGDDVSSSLSDDFGWGGMDRDLYDQTISSLDDGMSSSLDD